MVLLMSLSLQAGMEEFKDGPVIKGFGKHALVPTQSVDKNTILKVAFDVGEAAKLGDVNRRFNSLARFINMHVAAGVKKENITLALVVHGKASFDLLDNATFHKAHKQDNPSKALIETLLANNVAVILCGQTAAAYEITKKQQRDHWSYNIKYNKNNSKITDIRICAFVKRIMHFGLDVQKNQVHKLPLPLNPTPCTRSLQTNHRSSNHYRI